MDLNGDRVFLFGLLQYWFIEKRAKLYETNNERVLLFQAYVMYAWNFLEKKLSKQNSWKNDTTS